MSVVANTQKSYIIDRAIGDVIAECTFDENSEHRIELTQHPVQDGANISDNAIVMPVTVSVTIGFSAKSGSLRETFDRMIKIQKELKPIKLVTTRRIYENMMIKSIGETTDLTTENTLKLRLDLEEVLITKLKVVSVPARTRQKNPGRTGATTKAGAKQAQTTTPEREKSALKILSGG